MIDFVHRDIPGHTIVGHGTDESFEWASGCDRYRYLLGRTWAPASAGSLCLFVMLNPSTATHEHLDPTVRRCVDFAKRWGHSGLLVANAYAWRATDPDQLAFAGDPVGPYNDEVIGFVASKVIGFDPARAGRIVLAWGGKGPRTDGRKLGVARGLATLYPVEALRVTSDGVPGHPLYLRADTVPRRFMAEWPEP